MSKIDFRNGKYRARVCINKEVVTHSFADKNTAQLWVRYKSELLNEIKAFNPPATEILLFFDAIELKMRRAIKDNLADRTITDIKELYTVFAVFKDKYIHEITLEDFTKFANTYLETPTLKGGNRKNGTGKLVMPTAPTLRSKFNRLSGVYSNLQENGIEIENLAQKMGAIIDEKYRSE